MLLHIFSRMRTPQVTVIMPVYNGEAYLAEAIKSVLNQTFQDFELLLINDGSTDNSLKIIQNFNDSRLRVVSNESNWGLVRTRNRGLSEAKGQYLAMLDCDDIALPDRLHRQVHFLNQFMDYGVVGSQIIFINEQGKEVGRETYNQKTENIPAILFFNNYLAQSSVMIRKNILNEMRYREEFPPAEDYDLWVRLSRITKIKILPIPLVKYRLHTNNISVKKAQEGAAAVNKILHYQLEALQLAPTPHDFALHRQIAHYEFKKSQDFINEGETWLLKLNQANTKAQVYPVKVFQEELVKRFILICGNSGLGFWAFFRFFKFPLLNLRNLNPLDALKLFYKATIKP